MKKLTNKGCVTLLNEYAIQFLARCYVERSVALLHSYGLSQELVANIANSTVRHRWLLADCDTPIVDVCFNNELIDELLATTASASLDYSTDSVYAGLNEIAIKLAMLRTHAKQQDCLNDFGLRQDILEKLGNLSMSQFEQLIHHDEPIATFEFDANTLESAVLYSSDSIMQQLISHGASMRNMVLLYGISRGRFRALRQLSGLPLAPGRPPCMPDDASDKLDFIWFTDSSLLLHDRLINASRYLDLPVCTIWDHLYREGLPAIRASGVDERYHTDEFYVVSHYWMERHVDHPVVPARAEVA